ncbi:hypothetical protein CQ043_14960 [Paenibacillus sp. MYb63]|nr:hypothetical protein CQ043_14960 [Paenibacillus sp. MYb63]PRA50324.1 hypothetical protein CQ061_07880 [Paenibacillus sp. MYb67]
MYWRNRSKYQTDCVRIYRNYGSWKAEVEIHNKLSRIRVENQSAIKQKAFSIVSAITIGLMETKI